MSFELGFEVPNDWTSLKLVEVIAGEKRSIISGPFGSNISSKYFVEDGIPVIRGNNLSIDIKRFKDEGFVFVTEEKAEELKAWAQSEDIIFTAAGTLGQINIIPEDSKYKKYIISNKQLRIRLNKNLVLPMYVYYWLKNKPMIRHIINQNTGSTVPLINLTILKNLPISFPKLNEQIEMVNLLKSIDDKIELNNAINKNLEEVAKALFKRWFVDFEFPNENGEPYKSSGGEFEESELGLIPKGWRAGKFSELVTVKYGKDHKKLDDGSVPVYGSGGVMRYVDKVLYSDESVLIPRKGTLNNVMYINKPFWSVDTMFYTVMNVPYIAKFIYFFVRSKDLVSMNVGSAVPSMTTDILNKMPIVIPRGDVLEEFDRIASVLFDKIHNLIIENKKLADIRDSLLPKLMSGEIRVQMDQEDSYIAQTFDLPMVAESSEKYNAH